MPRKMVFRLSMSFATAKPSVQSVWFRSASSRSSLVREIRRVKCNARFHFVGLSSSNRSSISGHSIILPSLRLLFIVCRYAFSTDTVSVTSRLVSWSPVISLCAIVDVDICLVHVVVITSASLSLHPCQILIVVGIVIWNNLLGSLEVNEKFQSLISQC